MTVDQMDGIPFGYYKVIWYRTQNFYHCHFLGHVAQSVTCLSTDPGVASSILAQSHTFVEIYNEIFSMVILLPSLIPSRRVGCHQLQAKVFARSTG